ncbi:unnamed protein product [Coffea canephora]|uniref:DH200=94 genomic scaffold, scaffold_7732 n=2 Tax=Coffea TaxID=13442 RepID=A0A068VQA1_COFCA|nr:gibberellin-regulated protein 11-like [Coffea arabica]XP_027093656.1 gibberellin-regulated protein 11-like [Coffea arabica]XP_027150301.1 gibberellin-regulated protein 11-like [Coffea eugenioides]CDP21913.1 unnamed protein product [Coffea canephora]
MASSKNAALLVAFLCLILVHGINGDNDLTVEKATIDCPEKCAYRCSKSSRHKMCIRACNTCCQRCNCVPPGTSGNEDVCPCYARMTTHGGRHKCP